MTADRAHATHAPSAAHRWMACPGSVKLSEGFNDGSSVFAREGSAAHYLAHWCLINRKDADAFRGWSVGADFLAISTIPSYAPDGDTRFEVTAEMVDGVQIYLDVIRELQDEGYELQYEQRLQTPISDRVFGTGDAVGYNADRRRVVIVDFKYGKGVVVNPEGNEQLLTYAAGVGMRYHNRGVDEAELIIVQPRAPHPKGPVRRWLTTVEDLQAHVERAQVALNSNELNPGSWCKFCPAAGFCPSLQVRVEEAIGAVIRKEAMVGTDNSENYSAKRLAQAMADRELVAGWLKSVDRLAHNMGMKGEPPTGFKMVYATSHRKFINPQDACEVFELYGLGRDEIFEPQQMRSPAQLEKELPKKARKVMAALTHSPKTKLILVPEDDPRPSVDVKNVEGFEGFEFGAEE